MQANCEAQDFAGRPLTIYQRFYFKSCGDITYNNAAKLGNIIWLIDRNPANPFKIAAISSNRLNAKIPHTGDDH